MLKMVHPGNQKYPFVSGLISCLQTKSLLDLARVAVQKQQKVRLENEFIFQLRISWYSRVKTITKPNLEHSDKFDKRYLNLVIVVHVLQTMKNLVISRCCCVEDVKEMFMFPNEGREWRGSSLIQSTPPGSFHRIESGVKSLHRSIFRYYQEIELSDDLVMSNLS